MPKVLKYFNLNGLAEPLRYILHYTNQEFEDVRYIFKDWPIKNVKDALPFGQFPIYEDGDKVLNQTVAIARYISAGTELLPSDAWEQAKLDAIVLTIFDFHKQVVNVIHTDDPQEKEEFKKKLFNEHIEYYFSRFEKMLKDKNGYFNGKLSWAEFVLVGIIECAELFLETDIHSRFPTIVKLVKTVRGLPRVKEYIAKRGPYVLKNIIS